MSDKRDKYELLSKSIEKIDSMKKELDGQIKKLNSQKKKLEKELSNLAKDESEELSPELEKIYKKTCDYQNTISNINDDMKFYIVELSKIESLINYNIIMGDFDHFVDTIKHTRAYKPKESHQSLMFYSKLSGISCNIKLTEISKLEDSLYGISGLLARYEYECKIGLSPSKKALVDSVHKITDTIDLKFYERVTDFEDKVRKNLDERIDRLIAEAKEVRNREYENKRDEIKKNISNVDNDLAACNRKIDTIKEVYDLYNSYKNKVDPDIKLVASLSGELSKLGVLSKRDLKIILHTKKEKEEVKEEKVEEIIEEKTIIESETKKELDDLEYFSKPDTKDIICFLGKEGDSIMEDLSKHFDNSSRPKVIRELTDIFNELYSGENYIETGGSPNPDSNRNALALLKSPYKFNYKRFGVRCDDFRIHAIQRHSELLKNLGFGQGDIIFFGAIGVNDSKEKSYAYDRLGRRSVSKLSSTGREATLRSNFDYIEHITRNYVPIELLSSNDSEKLSIGEFNKQAKGGIDKSIENSKYVLYDVVDEDTKKNVYNYLYSYFTKQSQMMFDIINEYKNIKDSTFE